MSNNNFSRRRRGGMRFKPKGGLNPAHQKTDREAVEARADVVSEQGGNEQTIGTGHRFHSVVISMLHEMAAFAGGHFGLRGYVFVLRRRCVWKPASSSAPGYP